MAKNRQLTEQDDSEDEVVDEIVDDEKREDLPEEEPDARVEEPVEGGAEPGAEGRLKRFGRWVKHHKKVAIPAAFVLVLAVLAAAPVTRYALAGTVVKQRFAVKIVDSETKKPVSGVHITLAGEDAVTDNEGRAAVKARVGNAKLTIEKKYYEAVDRTVLVPILKQKETLEVAVKATGRQVPVTVVNKITRKPLAEATIKVLDTKTETDTDGKAILVLPADRATVKATLSHSGFNDVDITVTINTKQISANNFALTPEGKIYFMSNASGKLDVVQSNLDGTDRKVVLAGTGKEDKNDTILLASRDWKYLALKSRRDGGEYDKLFLIETANGSVTTMDEGDAQFGIYGWSDHRFVYEVNRVKVGSFDAHKYAIKSYNAPAKKITTLDQSQAQKGKPATKYYAAESFGQVFIVNGKLIYTVSWDGSLSTPRPTVIRTVAVDGTDKQDLKSFNGYDYSPYISSRFYAFGEIYFGIWNTNEQKTNFFEYEDGKITATDIDDTEFNRSYPNYFISPSAKRTFWTESRDGKNVFFTGNESAEDEKTIATLKDFATYGWFTDDYVLVSRDDSELYIMSSEGLQDSKTPLKVTNYYRPDYRIPGYGGGY